MPARVINCGHRGAMAYEPENSLKSFRRAAEMGAGQIELDVYLTADGIPVVTHGAMLHTKPAAANVRKTTLAELRELRCKGEPIPTLQESIDLCLELGLLLNIEIKDKASVRETVNLIRKNNLHDRCQVSNFHISILEQVKSLDPRVNLGYLVIPVVKWMQLKIAIRHGCESVNPLYTCAGVPYIHAAHKNGIKVYVWTVNSADDMRKLIAAGVDGIMTNKPDVLAAVKKEMGAE